MGIGFEIYRWLRSKDVWMGIEAVKVTLDELLSLQPGTKSRRIRESMSGLRRT